jgi:hypothetical protein
MEEFTDIAFETLPNETLFGIFIKMQMRDILNLCGLKHFRNFCNDENI